MKMVFIYVLLLENEKYYIGKTDNPDFRIDDHFKFGGCAWTKKYKPIKILDIILNCDDYDEDKYTRIYMDKYGINNVRGGSFVSIKLDKNTITQLEKMSNMTNNRCFKCGKDGHFGKNCDEEEWIDIWVCEYCDKEFIDKNDCEQHEEFCNKNVCYRCGRKGHYADSCYARKHIKGYYLKYY